ncbi:uncharacterized protein LOC132260728 [Phlebotomus argentipes]|uniref:uncharacterized protein LOC132260728 n=1 Tax=Phlebotomus argentipes TaxID=94469 RepID=UPI002892AB75|nr:uncharacterized protein LOC132260728 [Phlebotomus argentipes]
MGVDRFRNLFAGKFGEPLSDLKALEKRPWHPSLYVEVLRAFCTFINGDEPLKPLTVIGVRRGGLPRHEGIYDDDIVVKVNDIPVKGLKLREVQVMIRKSGKFVRVLVKDENDDALNADLLLQKKSEQRDWDHLFPWNNIEKPLYHESNCHMVPSQALERMRRARELAELIEEQRQQEELKRLAKLSLSVQAKPETSGTDEEKEPSIPSTPIPEIIRLYELFDTIFYLQKREPCSCEHVTYLIFKTQLPEGSEELTKKLIERHVQFNV